MGTIHFTPKVFVQKHNEFYDSESYSNSHSGNNIVAIQSLLAQLKAIDVTRIKVQNYILSLNVKIKQHADEIERIKVAPKIVEVFVDRTVNVPVVEERIIERLVDRVVEVEKVVRVVEERVVEVPTEIIQFVDKTYIPHWIYLLPIIQAMFDLYIYLHLGA